MKTISKKKQLEMMETLACASGVDSYDEVRELMFAAFNAEYGEGTWDFVPLTNAQQQQFEEWLKED